jgi:hypothetical protein
MRLAQVLQVRNSDNLLHNVHALSGRGNSFNVAQPMAGMMNRFPLKAEETMLQLSCDVHTWMRTYIGIVNHPYFAVTGNNGTFEIANVPTGKQNVRVWHEQYGELEQTVSVKPGTTTVQFTFSAAPSVPAGDTGKQPAGRNRKSR